MITHSGMVKVLDFGLAKNEIETPTAGSATLAPTTGHDAGLTMPGVIVGTAAYMSPEQARGRVVDRRSDVWSFGCVLFECFAGRAAFQGETASDLVAKIIEREPDWSMLPQETPARVKEILRRCLKKDAESRPRDIRDVRLELEDIAAGSAKPADSAREQSIAVLPFENLSGADDEYFADGMTDEILNALAQVEGLRVAARTSCFAFKGRREDLRLVGQKLDVATVLEGTVRRAGSRLRITVQMVNAGDGYQLWSERYDREITDVFAVQDEIASAIARRLRGTMGAEAERARSRRGTKNLEAYELLLRGRALQLKRGRFGPQAIACFERAVALDPEYAEAMAWLADAYRLKGVFGTSPSGEVMPMAQQLAERALAIDSGLSDAWMTLAAIEEQYAYDFKKSDELYERTLTLDPRHARARTQRALWRSMRGVMAVEEALAEADRAVQEDPLNAWVGGMHSQILGIAGMHAESIAEAERAMALDPDSFYPLWNLMRGLAWGGHYDRAIQEAPVLFANSGRHIWALGLLAWTFGRAERREKARAVYDEMEGRSRHEYVSRFWLAVAAGSAGLGTESVQWAEQAFAERDPLVLWILGKIPFWDLLRDHPRIAELANDLRENSRT
jgi:serine/threonine-protein kinase